MAFCERSKSHHRCFGLLFWDFSAHRKLLALLDDLQL
jgi:hypothetical protein